METLIADYLNLLKVQGYSNTTIRQYRYDLREFIRYNGNANITTVSREDVLAWLSRMSDKGLASQTLAGRLSAVSNCLSYLVGRDIIKSNPAAGIKRPKVRHRQRSHLTLEEVKRLLECPRNFRGFVARRNAAMLEILYGTGCRVSELVGADLESLCLETATLTVNGKGGKWRSLPLGGPAVAAARLYLMYRPAVDGLRALFVSAFRKRITTEAVQHMVRRYGRIVGIQKTVTPHVLRHTFATHMLDGGCNLRVLQELMGHAHLNTTEIYLHCTTSRLKAAYMDSHPRAR